MDCVADGTERSSSAALWSTSKKPVFTPAILLRAFCPPRQRNASQRFAINAALASALKVVGLMNVQYAIKDDEVYVLEVNPRASGPSLSLKATGVPMAQIAARVMAGKSLASI